MRLFEFPLLTDENVHPGVARTLRDKGIDVVTALETGLGGLDDAQVLEFASRARRVVVTHDRNVGRGAVLSAKSFVGVACVRPGTASFDQVDRILEIVNQRIDDLRAPFILVAAHDGEDVRVRVHQTPE